MSDTPHLAVIETFTVDGVDFLPYLLVGYTSEAYASARTVAKFPILDQTGTLTIPDLAEIVLVVDGVTEFAGVVWDIECEQYGDVLSTRLYTLRCVDWSFGLDTTMINAPHASDTLKEMLTTILANMSFFGVTLDPAQDDGPTLPDQTWDRLTLRQAIDRIVGLEAGWMWTIDPATKYFRAYEPYTLTVPRLFDETSAGGSGLYDLRWHKDFNRYINYGHVRYGPSGPALITQRIDGDGSTVVWDLSADFIQTNAQGTLTYHVSGVDATQTVSVDGSALWTVDETNNTIEPTDGTPIAVGDYILFEYLAQYPQYLQFIDSAGVLANGTFETIVVDENITTEEQAQSVADGILRRNGGPYKTISFKTRFGAGFKPLQAVTVHCPSLGITSATEYLISEVRCREVEIRDFYGTGVVGSYLEWSIVAQDGLTIFDVFEEMREVPRPAAVTASAPPPVTIPAEPAECSGAILWSDDFNSATALSADYTLGGTDSANITKSASNGPDLSQCLQFGSAAGSKTLTKSSGFTFAGQEGCASMDVRLGSGATGQFDFILRDGTDIVIDIATGQGFTPTRGFDIYYYDTTINGKTPNGSLYSDATWFNLRVAWRVSTYLGGGAHDHDLDGYVHLYINDVLVFGINDAKVGTGNAAQCVLDVFSFDCRDCRIDNLVIRDNT